MNYLIFRDGLEENSSCLPTVSKTREGHVVESYSVDNSPRFFVTLAGLHYCAHGNTLAEAIADAIWKDEKQRPALETLKEEINKDGRDRKISLQEFRVLTGACSAGCKISLKNAGLNGSPMTTKDIIKYFPEWGNKLRTILGWDQEEL